MAMSPTAPPREGSVSARGFATHHEGFDAAIDAALAGDEDVDPMKVYLVQLGVKLEEANSANVTEYRARLQPNPADKWWSADQ